MNNSSRLQLVCLAGDNLISPLSQWRPVGGGAFCGGTQTFTDTDAAIYNHRFYIVRLK